ncbi:ADP-ribosylation/Crystallin J1 [Mycena belliarum]|uniref:ADP-ribosylhydrolase ARH3 n=1 Tax=Mycena belliarum TaxID=1033014 RepID=A0AAD6UJS5_9AGAR|nr:ADP-ribosylation/Crystallin J1 [Mycena belliae]
MSSPALHLQRVVAAAPSTKIRTAILATALCDALGAPAEFHKRFSFDFIAHMAPNANFSLPLGVWTDDTSMALALARSIATFTDDSGKGTSGSAGGFDEADQLDAYYRWAQEGTLSATGKCFDIGNTIQRAVSIYRDALKAAGHDRKKTVLQRVGDALSPSASAEKAKEERDGRRAAAATALARIGHDLQGAVFGGNGSLMRVLPVGLAYWRDEAAAAAYAARSSATTHPNPVCTEACAAWTICIARVVQSAAGGGPQMTKLDVLHHFAAYPYAAAALKTALAADVPVPAQAADDPAAMEAHYAAHHPLLRLRETALHATPDDDTLAARIRALLPTAAALPSSGYVVHTLAAALYAFLATRTFADGALLTANMGDDADTVAAVYGGLAGVWYASEKRDGGGDEGAEALFWAPLVREWWGALVRRDVVEEVAEELVAFAEKQ